MRSPAVVASITCLSLAVVAGSLIAGPLDPPAGPVTASFKTLTDVEPRTAISASNTPGDADSLFKITQPGSYYLTGNVAGVAGKSGIEVTARGVTIDLNGFSLQGAPDSLAGIVAIEENGQVRDLTVRNGRVNGWGSWGLACSVAANLEVDSLRVGGCAGGIQGSARARVSRCHVVDMLTSDGISLGVDSMVSDCNFLTLSRAIVAGDYSMVRDCVIGTANGGSIVLGAGGNVSNVAIANGGTGIKVAQGSIVRDCTLRSPTGGGIIASNGNCKIENCSIFEGSGTGIDAGSQSQVIGCNIVSMSGHGISVNATCVVRGNNVSYCNSPGLYAGIRAVWSHNRIEDNHLTGNDTNLQVLDVENFIARNTVRGGFPNFDVAAGNDMAPVITNPGTTFTGATPWSNFAY